MAEDLIERKLESLRRCLARIRGRRPATLEALASDIDAQDVLVLNLSRAVQLCVDIGTHRLAIEDQAPPATMGETFSRLAEAGTLDPELARRLRAAVGFRNIAVHNYRTIDWAIVHAVSMASLHDFEAFARAMLRTPPE